MESQTSEEFRNVIKHLKDVNMWISPEGKRGDETTLLMYAIKRRQRDCIRVLLEEGADVNKANPSGTTFPLFMACEEGLLDIVLILLDYHANLMIETSDGRTCLIVACQTGRLAIVLRLVQERSLDVNYQTSKADTALLSAVSRGDVSIVRVLLGHGVSINQRNRRGISALHRACWAQHVEMVRFLLDQRARVYLDGQPTPIDISKHQGNSLILDLLERAIERQKWYRLDYWIIYVYHEHQLYVIYGVVLLVVVLYIRLKQPEIASKEKPSSQ
jgi:ankyrin repeat protein